MISKGGSRIRPKSYEHLKPKIHESDITDQIIYRHAPIQKRHLQKIREAYVEAEAKKGLFYGVWDTSILNVYLLCYILKGILIHFTSTSKSSEKEILDKDVSKEYNSNVD